MTAWKGPAHKVLNRQSPDERSMTPRPANGLHPVIIPVPLLANACSERPSYCLRLLDGLVSLKELLSQSQYACSLLRLALLLLCDQIFLLGRELIELDWVF